MRIFNLRSFSSVYRPNSGWVAFFLSIFVWCLVIALLGASVVFDRYGAGVLFATAGAMALANSAFALTVPKPVRK